VGEAPGGPIRILVVDDHALFANALAHDLAKEPEFEVVGTRGSVTEALEVVKQEPVDVVLLDVDLGAEHGGDFLRLARETGFPGKIIVVTVGVRYWEAVRLLGDGAAAIFLKQGTDEALFQMIRDVVSGKVVPPPAADGEADGAEPPGKPRQMSLTVRQRQVLRLVLEGKANKEIAGDLGLRESQVKQALQGLFEKTGVRTRGQLVRLAIEKYWDEVASYPPGAGTLPGA
jgi:two-component system, NarL family, nitrate/nitrite response regulator NarL